MENLGTIQFLVETVERLTKEGTTYKVELEHTKERVADCQGFYGYYSSEQRHCGRGCEGAQCGHEEGRRQGCR